MKIRAYRPGDEDGIIQLWTECGLVRSWNDPAKDIRRKLQVNPEWFLVGEDENGLIASCMVGYDGHRGWINYLAVRPDKRRQGFARLMVRHAESQLEKAGCPKINLQIRTSNKEAIRFYEKIGYATDEVISMGKRLIPD